MGNRAVITTSRDSDVENSHDLGVYLHWNGGRDSVEGFLEYCKLRGFPSPEKESYGWARFCQVVGNFIGGNWSIEIDKCCNLDCANGDNGVYIIEDWAIIDRKYYDGAEQTDYKTADFVRMIDLAQPERDRIFKEREGA